ncbi:DUF805 domain-containing protein [Deinococcus sp. 23YEL01]|uniref:DUF805 domain-containing protein n=1 Tax=Deinococcus sp. 23YEL01 TaxID=2745871 RepID=UPI001E29336A|nr:DUF805 domain-containing protein [Deinococcus sp. 23YEL01]MCD0168786.1 DUF805 domain-containing protein [Deinococcus sp. 23YEL01]
MNEFTEVITKKYGQVSGRARRREYWMYTLIYVLIASILIVIEEALGLTVGDELSHVGVLSNLFALAMFSPSLGVTIRRLHDTGRSGWWMLISIVPVIGWIAIIVFLVSDSAQGSNKWGPNPKSLTGSAATPAQNSVQNW